MKKTLTIFLTAGFLASTPTISHAESVKDIISYIVGKTKEFTSKSKMQEKLCKKASFLGMKYSLRSLNGLACKEKNIAALALTICKGYKDFGDSHCYKNASSIFPDETSKTKMLLEVVKTDAKYVGKVVCTAAPFFPSVGTAVTAACVVGNTAAAIAG